MGLLSSASGLGRSARLCIQQLENYGCEISTCDVAGLYASGDDVTYQRGSQSLRTNVSIFHLNAPMLLPGIITAGLRSYYKSYNIAYWAWELECLPKDWIDAMRYVDAFMVPSRFCQRTMQRYTMKPVLTVPHPIQLDMGNVVPVRPKDRTFRVLSVFNLGSSFERKNPLAVIRGFRAAFGDEEGVELVLKTSQGKRYPQDLAVIRSEIGESRNISVIDQVWSDEQLSELYCSSDAYISLHRSEGFGLTIAEAILMEVPVIATGWSGNVDFCSPDKLSAVAYKLVAFADDDPAYHGVSDAVWAEPSVEAAAHELQKVRSDRAGSIKRAREAKVEFLSYLGRNTYAAALDALVRRNGS
ncbi:glycosyltransferase family 4 protein [Hyphomicrobium sp.]|uniref:glycosyltransferase family 4 protein n=1 Tax=Hyphomicrobium sp. TaxID=82 RepID=UPI0025B7FE86|nr:glycosyltransferase family 4 protein [Hyphomicrobium sp.]